MGQSRRIAVAVVLTLALAAASLAASGPDLDRLARFIAGEFDSFEQAEATRRAGTDNALPRIHRVVSPIEVEGIEGRALLARTWQVGAATSQEQVEVLVLSADDEPGAIRMRPHVTDPPEPIQSAEAGFSSPAIIAAASLRPLAGRGLTWVVDGDGFAGWTTGSGTEDADPAADATARRVVARLDGEVLELTRWEDGGAPGSPSATAPLVLRRCRGFSGWAARRGDGAAERLTAIELHDQGGEAVVSSASPSDPEIRLRLTRPGRGATPALRLEVLQGKDTDERTMAAVTTGADGERLGVDLGWIEIDLHRSTAHDAGAPTELETLARWLTGSFSSARQAAEDPAFRDIRLHTARIWPERRDGIWLYVEQAVAGSESQPYRQRVYRLRRLDDTLFESQVFTFAEPLRFAGAWAMERPLVGLLPTDLTTRDGCAILLRRTGDGFAGSTLGDLCESSLRGATHATSEVFVGPHEMASWDRGFAADGSQVWGSTAGPYVFTRMAADAEAAPMDGAAVPIGP